MIKITINDQEYEVSKGITLEEIAKKYGKSNDDGEIVLAYRNNHLCELFKTVEEDSVISFVTTGNKIGNAAYRRSMILLMMKAFRDVAKKTGTSGRVRVLFSLSKGFYCEFKNKKNTVTRELLEQVTERMNEMVKEDIHLGQIGFPIL